jgi:hypothetical protein
MYFINMTLKIWNQSPAGLPSSFPVNWTHFERGVKNAVKTREYKWVSV